MTKLNRDYVLAPFNDLIAQCQNNVLMGLRIVETVDALPRPTPEELLFLQLSFGEHPAELEESRSLFKRWMLLNGFGDVHKSIIVALGRLVILGTIEQRVASGSNFNIDEFEKKLRTKVSKLNYPALVAEVGSVFNEPFEYQKHTESYNVARNFLEHTNGIVTERHCNNLEKDKLIVYGRRFKIFFKKGDEEVPAELGKVGPENAALMLGAEDFQIEFTLGQALELSLKQFLDILNTCVFIQADMQSKLKRSGDE